MTHFFLIIMAGRQIDESSKFFKVSIGTSKQADRDYLYLTSFCVSHGYFFNVWTSKVADFLEKVAKSIYGEHDENALLKLPTTKISARNLVRMLKANEQLSPTKVLNQNQSHLLDLIDTNYHFFRTNATSLPSAKRSTY